MIYPSNPTVTFFLNSSPTYPTRAPSERSESFTFPASIFSPRSSERDGHCQCLQFVRAAVLDPIECTALLQSLCLTHPDIMSCRLRVMWLMFMATWCASLILPAPWRYQMNSNDIKKSQFLHQDIQIVNLIASISINAEQLLENTGIINFNQSE